MANEPPKPVDRLEVVANLFGQLGIPLRCDDCGRLTGETDIGCKLCKAYRDGKKLR